MFIISGRRAVWRELPFAFSEASLELRNQVCILLRILVSNLRPIRARQGTDTTPNPAIIPYKSVREMLLEYSILYPGHLLTLGFVTSVKKQSLGFSFAHN